ncbi:DUF3530 family protein [Glaciecola sp. 2405UD65-10]|uniref:DUF3530 family protein n=1 Tax=Glaciecola sp. 2405UD65-10 TaxID=3397244 RepID=UPI003B5BC243
MSHNFIRLLYMSMLICSLLSASLRPAYASDFTYFLPSSDVKELALSVNEQTVPVALLSFPSEQALSKGVVVVVTDAQASGDAQNSLYHVAKSLPKWGWNTVFVNPSTAYLGAQQNKLDDSENSNEADAESDQQETLDDETAEPEAQSATDELNESSDDVSDVPTVPQEAVQTGLKSIEMQAPQLTYTFDEHQAFIRVLLEEVNAQYMQSPGYKILLMQGKSAASSLRLLQSTDTQGPILDIEVNALVISNVYWPEPELNSTLSLSLAKVQLPVLDLRSLSDNYWAKETFENRLIQSRVALKPFYRQREILGVQMSRNQSEYFTKEVVGWMRYLGW